MNGFPKEKQTVNTSVKFCSIKRGCFRLSCAKPTQRSECWGQGCCAMFGWLSSQVSSRHTTVTSPTQAPPSQGTHVCSFCHQDRTQLGQFPHSLVSLHPPELLWACPARLPCPAPFPLPPECRGTRGATSRVWLCKQNSRGCPLQKAPLLTFGGAGEVRVSRPGVSRKTPLELQWGHGPSTSSLPRSCASSQALSAESLTL